MIGCAGKMAKRAYLTLHDTAYEAGTLFDTFIKI